ncbi:MAG: hypothetical protein ACI9ON_001762 [Limisphaerales bacterium]|jgi:hypothetical protein
MTDSIEAAKTTASQFIRAFNDLDHGALARTLNFPHTRLAQGRFVTIETASEFVKLSQKSEKTLLAEGWHHTALRTIEPVHAGSNKVHLAMTIDRCQSDGTVYNAFDTFWIATLVDDHWGIQFRSSFLR